MTTKGIRNRARRGRRPAGPSLLVMTLFMAGAMALLGGCEINKPEMPTFDTSLTVPLGVERVEILDLIEDEDFLVVGGDSSLGFFIDGDPDTMALDLDLAVEIQGQNIEQGIGNFDLADVDPMAYSFELADIWPPSSGLTDEATIVPAFPIDVTSDAEDIPDIESATLAEGQVTITLTNGLAVPISADSGADQVVLDLIDPDTGTGFASFTFPVIPPGGQATRSADLAGTHLPGEVAVAITGGSPGSSGATVVVSGTDAIDISAVFSELVVSAASAVVAAQEFQTSIETDLPEDYEITRATIASGSSSLVLVNNMPVPCTARITWPDLLDIADQPLTEVFVLAPGQTSGRQIDFSGRILVDGGAPVTALAAELVVNSPGSGGNPVTMSAGDGLTADLGGCTIEFGSVTGVLPAFDVALDPVEEEIDLPDEMDGLELTTATMVLRLTNSSGLPGDLDLTLTGTSSGGSVRTLQVSETIAPAIDRAPRVTSIILDENNSTIVDFLNNLPETITMSGSVQVGGPGVSGTVHAGDFAVVAWETSAPVEVVITGSTIDTDPKTLDLDQDMRDMINDHALSAHIQTEILNHMPMAVELRILVGTDLAALDTDPLLVIGPLSVDSATVDQATHTVAQATISTPVIELTQEQARIFALPGVLTAVEVYLPSTNGNPVRMMSSDFLEVQGIVQMDILVNDEW